MLITKKSRKRSDVNPFRSRFEEADAFPMRQYLRIRDELVQAVILTVIQLLFSVALFIFTQRVYMAIQRHGQNVEGWLKWGSLSLIALFALITLGRAIRNLKTAWGLRAEMKKYRKLSHSKIR